MTTAVFISYSKDDKFFAELLEKKLMEENISVWRDASSLHPGDEWRQTIDFGIAASKIIVVALSKASCASHYVTYEWATGLAQKKAIIPVLLEHCDRHPKLEPLQYIDFRNHSDGTWQALVMRIKVLWEDDDIDTVSMDEEFDIEIEDELSLDERYLADKIIGYMNDRGFRIVSFDRIRKQFGESLDNSSLERLIRNHPRFLSATLSKNRPGIAML